MQFTIRRLLLIFPAFFVGTFAAVILDSGKCVLYKWSLAINDVRLLHSRIELASHFRHDIDFSVDTINDWLAGMLPASDPLAQELYISPNRDPWGNPYRCVCRTADANELLGIYSLGHDGVTQSDGNDVDDLNSWNNDCYRWYVRDINNRLWLNYTMLGAVFTPIIYMGILGCAGCIRSIRKSRVGAESSSEPKPGKARV